MLSLSLHPWATKSQYLCRSVEGVRTFVTIVGMLAMISHKRQMPLCLGGRSDCETVWIEALIPRNNILSVLSVSTGQSKRPFLPLPPLTRNTSQQDLSTIPIANFEGCILNPLRTLWLLCLCFKAWMFAFCMKLLLFLCVVCLEKKIECLGEITWLTRDNI